MPQATSPDEAGVEPMQGAQSLAPRAWMSPGRFIAQELGGDTRVRAVHENVLPDGRYFVTVALKDDPDELMYRVFDAERAAMKKFSGLPINVRVTPCLTAEDVDAMTGSASWLVIFDRK